MNRCGDNQSIDIWMIYLSTTKNEKNINPYAKTWGHRKRRGKSLILVCRARGYNYKQILSVVNDYLKKHNNSISEKAIFNLWQRQKKCSGMAKKSFSR